MTGTIRKKNGYRPDWVESMSKREQKRFYGDSFNHDGDKNPPRWFKQNEQRKHRKKQNQRMVDIDEDTIIDSEFKMPYYT